MNKDITNNNHQTFENIRKFDDSKIEFWSARDLAKILEYSEYRHFLPVIEKAKKACENSGKNIHNHFEDILDMVSIGSKAKRSIDNVKLTRYACYLIIQNADPSKEIVAGGQTYFAIQTRKQELKDDKNFQGLDENKKRLFLRNELKDHNKQLAEAASKAGVSEGLDYAIFQNHGYQGLYGGLGAKQIHKKKNLKKSQQILDHMGSTELAANLFRATQAEEKLRRDNIKGKKEANKTHLEIGQKVRKAIEEIGGTMPEDLPTPKISAKSLEKEQKKVIDQKNGGEDEKNR